MNRMLLRPEGASHNPAGLKTAAVFVRHFRSPNGIRSGTRGKWLAALAYRGDRVREPLERSKEQWEMWLAPLGSFGVADAAEAPRLNRRQQR